jgi:hypothetical protein
VILQNAVNATLAETQATGTIFNDDRAPALIISDASIAEGPAQGAPAGIKTLNFNVSLTAPSAQTVSVNYATANGTARADSDYQAQSGSLNFSPGETSKTISININGDAIVENDEAFYVLLSGAVNANTSKGRGVGIIQNDDTSG